MSLTNPNKVVTEARLAEFYQSILPYLGAASGVTMDTALSSESGNPVRNNVLYDEFLKRDKGICFYGTCNIAATATKKVVTLSETSLITSLTTGMRIAVKFMYSNTASAPTLKVGDLTEKNIKYKDSTGTIKVPEKWWGAYDIVEFVYDGTQWLMQPTFGMTQWKVYSDTERPVGTWIDGKTIYEKTIATTPPTVSTAGTEVDKTIDLGFNLDKMISMSGFYIKEDGVGGSFPSAMGVSNNKLSGLRAIFNTNAMSTASDRNKLIIKCSSTVVGTSSTNLYITIRYTKV